MQHHDYAAAKLEDPYDHICATTSSASASASVNTRRTSKHGTANRALFTAHNTHLKKVFQEFSPALLSCLNANPFAHKTKHWSCQGSKFWLPTSRVYVPCLFYPEFPCSIQIAHLRCYVFRPQQFHRFFPFFAKLQSWWRHLEPWNKDIFDRRESCFVRCFLRRFLLVFSGHLSWGFNLQMSFL